MIFVFKEEDEKRKKEKITTTTNNQTKTGQIIFGRLCFTLELVDH